MEELRFSDFCANCRRSLQALEKILFVEKEVGRCFCCEDCIKEYFQPTVDFMEEEWQKLRAESDLSEHEAMRFHHYKQLTLEDPDEVWLEQTETGERHFTFISHFRNGEDRISYVVICLTIDGIPSFVFLGFPTRDEELVDEYRRGVDLRVDAEEAEEPPTDEAAIEAPSSPEDAGTSESSYFERLYSDLRQPGDIPRELFDRFESFVDPTIDDPDEIWHFVDDEGNEFYTFITSHRFDDDDGNADVEDVDAFTMIAVCEPKLIEGEGRGFEVIFTFPTIDPGLVQHFRKGINSLNKAFGVGWARGRVA